MNWLFLKILFGEIIISVKNRNVSIKHLYIYRIYLARRQNKLSHVLTHLNFKKLDFWYIKVKSQII